MVDAPVAPVANEETSVDTHLGLEYLSAACAPKDANAPGTKAPKFPTRS